MLSVFFVFTFLLVTLSLLPLWRNDAWWVRSLDFPRLQLSLIALLLLLLELVFLDLSKPSSWGLFVFTVLPLIYQVWWIVPYTWLFPVEVKPARAADRQRTIRVMTANVLMPNRNAAALLELVRNHSPDILVTLESDAWWQERLDTLETDFPYTIKCPLDNLYGMHVYSRLVLADSHTEYLVEPDKPSMHTLVYLPSGHRVRMHFLHPAPPSPTENEASAERDAELIIVAKSVAGVDTAVIVAGDLNDVAWSRTTRLFRKISGLLDPRVGRGMFNTFHSKYWFVRWPLDHLFHSNHFGLSGIHRLQSFGSDHFALLTELVFESERDVEGLEANADDQSWAKAKAEEQGVSSTDVPQPGKR